MNAKEAQELAAKNQEKAMQYDEFMRILNAIEYEASQGRFNLCEITVSETNQQKLKTLGYSVRSGTFGTGFSQPIDGIIIGWGANSEVN